MMSGKKFRETITLYSKDDENLCYDINKTSRVILLTIECVDDKSNERGKHDEQEKAAFQGGERNSLHIGGGFLFAGYYRTDRKKDSGEIQVSPGKISFKSQERYLPSTSKGWEGYGTSGTDRRSSPRNDRPDNGTNAGNRANTGEPQKYGYVAMGWIDEQLQRFGDRNSDARRNLSGRPAGRDGGYGIAGHRSRGCFQGIYSCRTQSEKKHDKECTKKVIDYIFSLKEEKNVLNTRGCYKSNGTLIPSAICFGDIGTRAILKWSALLAFSPIFMGIMERIS